MKHRFSIMALMVMMVLTLMPTNTHAMTVTNCDNVIVPGNIVKRTDTPHVYFVGQDNTLHLFDNAELYKTWFRDFSAVIEAPRSCFDNTKTGTPMPYRPGSVLVKNPYMPAVYAVLPNRQLQQIENTTVARSLFGADWEDHIVIVPDAFFASYTIVDDVLDEEILPEGMFVEDEDGTLYVVDMGNLVEIDTEYDFVPNRANVYHPSERAIDNGWGLSFSWYTSEDIVAEYMIEATIPPMNRGEDILWRSEEAMNDLDSFRIEGYFGMFTEDEEVGFTEGYALDLSGAMAMDACSLSDFQFDIDFTGTEYGEEFVQTSVLLRGSSETNNLYINITDLSAAEEIEAMFGMLPQNTWFHIDMSDEFDTSNCEDTPVDLYTSEFMGDVYITSIDESATYEGRDAYHIEFLPTLKGKNQATNNLLGLGVDADMQESDSSGDIWIEKDTYRLLKIDIHETDTTWYGETERTTATFEFFDFNRPVGFLPPDDSIDLMEFFTSYYGMSDDSFLDF